MNDFFSSQVFDIGTHYKTRLYSGKLNKESPEYAQLKSEVHLHGAEKLLELCCANKGVYIKVRVDISSIHFLFLFLYSQTPT